MKPVDLKTAGFENVIVFAEDQPEYQPLPAVETEPGVIWTRWEPTTDERKAIAEGKRIDLFIWTFRRPLQPIALAVEGVEYDTAAPVGGGSGDGREPPTG